MSRVLQFQSLKRLLPSLYCTFYFLTHYSWTCGITILTPTLKMTKKHIPSLNSNLSLEIVQTTGWVLDVVDNWCFYLNYSNYEICRYGVISPIQQLTLILILLIIIIHDRY